MGRPIYGGYACEGCGVIDSTLRFRKFPSVMSFLIISRRSVEAGVFCEDCGRRIGRRLGLRSALLGWWGVPWGVIWTIGALVDDLTGGELPAEENLRLLKALELRFRDEGDFARLREVLAAGERFGDHEGVAQLAAMNQAWCDDRLGQVVSLPQVPNLPTSQRSCRDWWLAGRRRFSNTSPRGKVFVCGLALVILFLLIQTLSGSNSRSASPISTNGAGSVTHLAQSGGYHDSGGTLIVTADDPRMVTWKRLSSIPLTSSTDYRFSADIASTHEAGEISVVLESPSDDRVWFLTFDGTGKYWGLQYSASEADDAHMVAGPFALPAAVGSLDRIEVGLNSGRAHVAVDGFDVGEVLPPSMSLALGSKAVGLGAARGSYAATPFSVTYSSWSFDQPYPNSVQGPHD